MEIPVLLLGLALLVAGRRVFWLFVGGAGFLYGWSLAPILMPDGSDGVLLFIAVAAGVIGAVLAIFAQKLAVGFAGGMMGGYLAWAFVHGTTWEPHHFTELSFLVGFVIGAVLVLVLFDWALILWSSIAGSALILQTFHPAPLLKGLLFLALAALGVIFQANLLGRERQRRILHSYDAP